MRFMLVTLVIWICARGSSAFAADAPDVELFADPEDLEDNPEIDSRGAGREIDPGTVTGYVGGLSEENLVDTPAEELVAFASTLWVHFSSGQPYEFEDLDPGEAELDVLLEIARKSRVLSVELQGARKQAMCSQIRQYQNDGLSYDQAVEMAVNDYQDSEVKQQQSEEVASYIREEIENVLGPGFLSGFEREAALYGERSTAYRVSGRNFFGMSNEEFAADCEM